MFIFFVVYLCAMEIRQHHNKFKLSLGGGEKCD